MVELHCHLDGSLTPEDILALGKTGGVSLPSHDPAVLKTCLTADEGCRSLAEYLSKFDLPLSVLQTPACLEEAVYRLLCRLAGEGILYAEVRYAPMLHCRRGMTQSDTVAAALRGVSRAVGETGIGAQLILCLMRGFSPEKNLETVETGKKYYGMGVCALDLAGDEANYPIPLYAAFFDEAKKAGIPFTLHAGEAADAGNVRAAVTLGAARIGHGVRSVTDGELIKQLAEKRILLENCYTSNLQTGAASAAAYPLPVFLAAGIPVTLATDDTAVSDTCLKKEYRRVQTALGLSTDTLRRLAENAALGAFLPAAEKERLKERVSAGFDAWLADG